ncbi:MAG: glycoside hydrolase family 15 protein [Bacteroidota bacterium]
MNEFLSAEAILAACDYEAIGAYAAIGDCHSAALVSRSGSIDWLCLPDFSSPSIFAALLDRKRGGRFLIRPRGILRTERRYLERSAVLETTFHCRTGVVKITDFMAMHGARETFRRLVRMVECVEGIVPVAIICQPKPDYGRAKAEFKHSGDAWHLPLQDNGKLLLHADKPLAAGHDGDWVGGTWQFAAGERCRCVLAFAPTQEAAGTALWSGSDSILETLSWWEHWCSRCSYDGPFPEQVMRSCLTLKLLTCRPTGAVIAAITTSLPEAMDSGRNWDYRYCWLRDTSLLLQSFIDMGFREESNAFLRWLLHVARKPRLQPLYDVHGHPVPDGVVLSHLEGYRGSGPVRIGNSANQQLQLDIYGELIQTAYRFVARGGRLNDGEKRLLTGLGDTVCRLWRQPDHSIWETRGPPRHYTYSKLMCWVALDRLLSLHQILPLDIGEPELRNQRDSIRKEIDARGFDPVRGSYVGYFGGTEPDASLLLMSRYGYLDPTDQRMSGTYRYITDRLSVDGLLYRYPPGKSYDGVESGENLFAVCSFWAVDYLARAGRVDEAQGLFERLLGLANDVGLYSEQFDVSNRQALGNFPQAFTHSGLVTAALAIEEAMKGRRGGNIPA